eukprot:SAG31_NODE_6132_length_2156_cov_1.936801_2_plen_150_part_00
MWQAIQRDCALQTKTAQTKTDAQADGQLVQVKTNGPRCVESSVEVKHINDQIIVAICKTLCHGDAYPALDHSLYAMRCSLFQSSSPILRQTVKFAPSALQSIPIQWKKLFRSISFLLLLTAAIEMHSGLPVIMQCVLQPMLQYTEARCS